MLSKKSPQGFVSLKDSRHIPRRSRRGIQGIILTSLLTLLGSCSNSAAIESLISPDPALKKGKTEEVSNQTQSKPAQDLSSTKNENSAVATNQSEKQGLGDNSDNNKPKNRVRSDNITSPKPPAENSIANLLLNFPDTFPVYPQAELQEINKSEDDNSGMLVWNTTDNRQAVADYYQAELSANEWDVIKPFTINPNQKIARAIAVKDDLRVELSLLRESTKEESNSKNTRLSVVYHPLDQDIPQSSISQWSDSSETNNSDQATPTDAAIEANSDESPSSKAKSPSATTKPKITSKPKSEPRNNSNNNISDTDFADLDEVTPQLKQPIKSVAALNILTPYTREANVELTKFAPNEIITRGEYARWLIAANNRYYADNPGKKIYLASKTSQPAFNDVKSKHPDFEAIQSLAEAGLIPSRLTEDSTRLLFRPDAPLIRQDLVTWKVPLDTRKSLPKASIEAIKESWGFQDAADIDSSAIRALYADFQNGDRANVRRMFGYTTLFQPKKPVTRGEAAASLWYFGFQGDGITAKEVLESEAEAES